MPATIHSKVNLTFMSERNPCFFNLLWRDTIVFFPLERGHYFTQRETNFFLNLSSRYTNGGFFRRETVIKFTLEDMSMPQQVENCQYARRGTP
jgi:hypothetical protein